jgi:hypothetical protein
MSNDTVFLCRAGGEGSHNFKVCASLEDVVTFYGSMFGEDTTGDLMDYLRDEERWAMGVAYHEDLYCAKFDCWKVEPAELSLPTEEKTSDWEQRCAALYQVLGSLSHSAGCFDHPDVIAALDVAVGRGDVENLLPWPKDADFDARLAGAPEGLLAPLSPQKRTGCSTYQQGTIDDFCLRCGEPMYAHDMNRGGESK